MRVIAIAQTLFAVTSSLALAESEFSDRRLQQSCGLPSNFNTGSNSKLPDPFTKVDGSKVTTKADWDCRRQEIWQMFEKYELGAKPPKPSSVTASLSGSTLSVTCSEGGKSISFSATISFPSSGSAPYPAIIAVGGSSIPTPSGVAVINFDNEDMASQASSGSRGQGKFYQLYGSSHSAGALMAWAWGVSRLIDGLELAATNRIDVKKLGVTGCSRNGKGAMVVGAFDDRIALVIPQESGAGGAACWRISDSEKSAGKNIQTASQIIGENVWFPTLFNNYARNVPTLPMDHHMLAGLIAPRGLMVVENTIDWLGPASTTGCMRTTKLIYQALGVPDNMGLVTAPGHSHCVFPSGTQSDLDKFTNRFLKGQAVNTAGVDRSTSNVQASQWITWTAPTLTNSPTTPPTTTPQPTTVPPVTTQPPTPPPPTTTPSTAPPTTTGPAKSGIVCNYEGQFYEICRFANAWSYENGSVCVGITRCVQQSPPYGVQARTAV